MKEATCFRCGKTFPAGFRRKAYRAFCSEACRYATYRAEHKKPASERTCHYCGKTFTVGYRGAPIKYCSRKCLDKSRQSVSNEGVVSVGRRFVRADDLAECVVCQDARGLPYALALREMAYAQEVPGQ